MSFVKSVNSFTKRFKQSTSGTVGVMLGLSAVPLVLVAGIAVDYSHGIQVKANLQAAVDNAALAAGYDTRMSDADMLKLVKKYLEKNGATTALKSLDKVTVTRIGTTGLKVRATGKVDNYLMRVIGNNTTDIGAETYIKNNYGNLEVALVLDNTFSMSAAGKMTALKSAAHSLVNELHDNKGPAASLQMSLVPFSQYVNIGLSRRNAIWADVPADYDETISGGYWHREVTRTYNCRMEDRTRVRDGVSSTYQVRVCDHDYGPKEWRTYSYVKSHKWKGCVGSRNYPLNTKDTSPNSKIPGLLDRSCSREITTLTPSKSVISNEIDNMSASGNQTYIPAGLMWGWRMLSSDVPLTDGVSKAKMVSDNYTKAIVLMTDGENTVSPNYPDHRDSNPAEANKLTKEICQNIKDDGTGKQKIRIYTVAFAVTDPATKKMIRECATNDSYYFDAADSAALAAAFEEIGRSLVTMFISQ